MFLKTVELGVNEKDASVEAQSSDGSRTDKKPASHLQHGDVQLLDLSGLQHTLTVNWMPQSCARAQTPLLCVFIGRSSGSC